MQMFAACSSHLTPLICWLLALLIIGPIAMIFAMCQHLGAYWLVMRNLLAMQNSWVQKLLFQHLLTTH
ncbi:hypothetical protein CDL12_03655 [Handroanthus impetiginosus]|uniref:Uncharacterized protein n=1 Tax=Handroanthus impetiginosus TaxID=429701 RepID=A0A2G9I1K9_9LAMI|nr:hypothetical protein CDL12_03655 [Handroanthus impetiginosus]